MDYCRSAEKERSTEKEVIMLEVAESIEMKADEYRHDFRPAHSTFPIAVLTGFLIQTVRHILSCAERQTGK